jgi:hypothetical protein
MTRFEGQISLYNGILENVSGTERYVSEDLRSYINPIDVKKSSIVDEIMDVESDMQLLKNDVI